MGAWQMRHRYDLTDLEWSIMRPLLPNKSRGVPRVDDRRVINGILALPNRQPVDGYSGAIRAVHDLLQSVRSMAQSRVWD
jgi:hypothetical protein